MAQDFFSPTKIRSKSQKLRAVLYLIWDKNRQNGKEKRSAEQFYDDYMEKVITELRKYLD